MNNLGEDITMALYRLSRSLRERTRLQTEDLNMQQWFVLHLLAEGVSSSAVLSRELNVSAPTVSTLIDQMVQHGLIERAPSEQDRRTIQLRLTTGGRFKIQQAKLQKADRITQLLGGLTNEEKEQLRRLLVKLANQAESTKPVAAATIKTK